MTFCASTARVRSNSTADDKSTLSPDLMLAAILLDRAGFTAAAVAPGRVIVLTIERFLTKSVAELLGQTLPDRKSCGRTTISTMAPPRKIPLCSPIR